ncbi:NUDIX domain-containing protein [Desulfitibacter alkalitolerans]|uniref:NUDIX domain-containing protein n=1 Tax=Desulfitibacter alkalitolerans TaxID=264641 RepID=UPI0006867C2D|nr:NUDIX domain-containing protein [Desulfitibacter alkalitolerans]
METLVINVAILEENNRFLISQSHGEGLWEFPGGGLTPGEDPEVGLIRSVKEKLGIEITILDIFKVVSHVAEGKQIFILAYLCVRHFGEPEARHYNDFKWLTLDELRSGKFVFSESDKRIINKISVFSGCGPSLIS